MKNALEDLYESVTYTGDQRPEPAPADDEPDEEEQDG